jgi:gliding motility-associated-like protein
MRYWLFILPIMASLSSVGQIDERDRKPKITGQHPVSTNEEQAVTIQLTDLVVSDKDDWFYPLGFTLHVYEGSNYSLTNTTISPAVNFSGTLSVPVSVNDGDKESDKFNLQVQVRPVNDAPVITGQQAIVTNEDQPFTLQPSQLIISDPDDTQFSLIISAGTNYTFSGNTITPAPNFSGTLSVTVQVNDGEAVSAPYTISLNVTAVNDAPQITGQQPVETDENKSLTILLTNLVVFDPDNNYPADFSLLILPSPDNKYAVSGSQVTPVQNFEGTLSIPVQVNDGTSGSNVYMLQLKVNHGNDAPVITGQNAIVVNEDEAIPIQLAQLIVKDNDNVYPNGFTLHVLAGNNYTVAENIVTPTSNYAGPLKVNVSVNDGASESSVFQLSIVIRPINDAPQISKFEADALAYEPGKGLVSITELLEITDVDNDSLQQGEIRFDQRNYIAEVDVLTFANSTLVKGTFDTRQGVLSLSGKAPLAEYAKVIRSVQYNFLTAADFEFKTKTLYITVNDGKISSEKVQRDIKLPNAIEVNLDIPTAFTPNGDHANDTWSIKPLKHSDALADIVVRVYNKSGKLLFEAVGFEKEWDGRLDGEPLPADTYFFTVDFNGQFSKTSVKGIVAILR